MRDGTSEAVLQQSERVQTQTARDQAIMPSVIHVGVRQVKRAQAVQHRVDALRERAAPLRRDRSTQRVRGGAVQRRGEGRQPPRVKHSLRAQRPVAHRVHGRTGLSHKHRRLHPQPLWIMLHDAVAIWGPLLCMQSNPPATESPTRAQAAHIQECEWADADA